MDPGGSPQDFGDEPLLLARRLGVPVIVGEDRYEAGQFAERSFGPQLHLLDDGFQHRALARDFDIVLVTPEDARDRLLPAGRLREPLDFIVARRCCCTDQRRFARIVSFEWQTGMAGATGHFADECSQPPSGFLRNCAAAEFPSATAYGRH